VLDYGQLIRRVRRSRSCVSIKLNGKLLASMELCDVFWQLPDMVHQTADRCFIYSYLQKSGFQCDRKGNNMTHQRDVESNRRQHQYCLVSLRSFVIPHCIRGDDISHNMVA
jgi:hypothetical protein